MCSGLCVDTDRDPQNCGTCANPVCHANSCSGGVPVCVPGYTNCPGATFCGGNQCTNLQENNENCGACGNRCAVGQVCGNGVCSAACPPGTTRCGSQCIADFQSDLFHCGGCAATPAGPGAVCGPGNFCQQGVCQPYSAVGCNTCPCSRCPTTMPMCCDYPSTGDAICTPSTTCPPTG
jgi:hypothetical protein